jgi:V/A-type H+-transporting ATPase subunit I
VVGGLTLGWYSKIHDIQALLIWSVILGVIHLNLGFALGIRNVYQAHGAKLAVQEKLAWITLELGAAVAVWGLLGGPRFALPLGGAVFVASLALLWMGAAHVLGAGYVALLEVFGLVGNTLSYTRLAAIGASKAGIALAVVALAALATGGATNAVWWTIYALGMLAITALAILSAGLQSLRLQYVEFFQKFYTGGGRPYLPFGRRAT